MLWWAVPSWRGHLAHAVMGPSMRASPSLRPLEANPLEASIGMETSMHGSCGEGVVILPSMETCA